MFSGIHENKTINVDQKIPINGVMTRPLDPAFAANPSIPELASVRNEESIGREHYDGVNFVFKDRIAKRFQVDANYTLAWAYGYDTGGGSSATTRATGYAPFASYEWGPSPNDERHHITVAGVVDLPKGFELAPILQYGSARPWQPTNGTNTLNTGGGTTNRRSCAHQRSNQLEGVCRRQGHDDDGAATTASRPDGILHRSQVRSASW